MIFCFCRYFNDLQFILWEESGLFVRIPFFLCRHFIKNQES
nr:MAG TPA: Trans-activation protein X [Caudoviricetes sp.]